MKRYFHHLCDELVDTPLHDWAELVPEIIEKGLSPRRYGDLKKWQTVLEQLPSVDTSCIDLKTGVTFGTPDDVDAKTRNAIEHSLRQLIPWRKGPFTVHGSYIDSEWRSNWKWDRLLPHIRELRDHLVLDVGCGNGYYAWRMLGEGARRVIGIDPSPRFVVQFYMLKHFAPHCPVDVLPTTLENLTCPLPVFDSVFSMGVMYHRHSPIDHLRQLKAMMRPGGQLILETLVIEGDDQAVLVPSDRYAMMNNVWFMPSPPSLLGWLAKVGFVNPRLVDLNKTSTDEQRATEWMTFHSLANFLDHEDPNKTVEGYPAPTRAIFVAECD